MRVWSGTRSKGKWKWKWFRGGMDCEEGKGPSDANERLEVAPQPPSELVGRQEPLPLLPCPHHPIITATCGTPESPAGFPFRVTGHGRQTSWKIHQDAISSFSPPSPTPAVYSAPVKHWASPAPVWRPFSQLTGLISRGKFGLPRPPFTLWPNGGNNWTYLTGQIGT